MVGVTRLRFLLQRLERWGKEKEYRRELKKFREMNKADNRMTVTDEDLWVFLNDATKETIYDTHYIYHPAWATRIIKEIGPPRHVDISSTLHFCSMLSAFLPVDYYEFRPARLNLSNLTSQFADLTQLPFETGSLESVSCMHTIEHVGLGRYGDPLDPGADVKALKELQRVTQANGNLLIVTPVGLPKVQFNGQRIYSFELIHDLFDNFELRDFSLVTDSGDFVNSADPALVKHQQHGCGCFWYIKKPVNESI
jgi:hypothetical protein